MSLTEKLREKKLKNVRELVANPLWYKDFTRSKRVKMQGGALAIGSIGALLSGQAIQSRVAHEYYDIFEQLLAEGAVYLGDLRKDPTLYNWDSERVHGAPHKIIIHHTSRAPGITQLQLSATELLRLYVPVYQNPPEEDKERVKDKPIHSGHYDDKGVQNFWPYHWLIRSDGTPERLLADNETGWQAGKWAVNCDSVAICVDDDLTHKRPDDVVLEGIGFVIGTNYRAVDLSPATLLGHNEVNPNTTCPGNDFEHWKKDLLGSLT